jgi:hypothetical protein
MISIYDYNDPDDVGAFFSGHGDTRTLWDIEHPTGPAEIIAPAAKAKEMLERHPKRYRIRLPADATPGPHVGTDARGDGKTGRIVLSAIAFAALALTSFWNAPADAASVVLCAGRTQQANVAGSQVNIPNTSKAYALDGQGCAVVSGLNDIAIFRANGYSEGGKERSIVFNTGVATGTTSFLVGTLPAGAYIQKVIWQNVTANAAGNLSLGSTSGGADIVAANACAANCLTDNTIAKTVLSSTSPTLLYITSSAWGSANVNVTVVYGYW